jgi:hypothetical protein
MKPNLTTLDVIFALAGIVLLAMAAVLWWGRP